MPTYEYECKSCKKIFEIFQSITAPPLKTCPKCGKPVKRLIGMGAGLIFSRTSSLLKNSIGIPKNYSKKLLYSGKGSGFYSTDYRKSNSTDKGSSKSCSTCVPKSNCKVCK